jgi:hypothetical protein
MTQGMVISLKMKITEMGDRGSKSVIDTITVKEQRVDGSSNSRNLGFVRCTLVAGKPVLGRKIHSHSDNSMFKRSIHTTRSNIDPFFVTGLAEAEGSFTLGFFKSDSYKMGYQIQAIFKITMHKKDNDLLCQIQDYFDAGSVTKHGETTLQYTVKSLKDLDKIITHFDKYPLLSQKYADYRLFRDGVLIIKNKQHLDRKGFIKVLSIKASMNLGLSDELKLSFPDIKPVSRPLCKTRVSKNTIDPN